MIKFEENIILHIHNTVDISMLEYYLWFCFATKANGDNRQSTCGSKPSSGGGLMAHVSLDQPEGHLNFHKVFYGDQKATQELMTMMVRGM